MSEQTARERLRELLDEEPGVKWIKENPGVTYWSDGTHGFIAEEYGGGKLEVKTLMTPEQAVAATLGDTDATATRHGDADVVTCVPDDYTAKLMAEVKQLQAENAKLRELENIRILQVRHCEDLDAKNAKLLKELEAEHALAETLGHYHEDAKAENAKLRKLAQDIWDWLAPTAISSATPLKGLHDRMRELGIKEDECEQV